ncbi:MAG: CAP domain-containing protein [Planctomycetota bacterium]|jgi:uncharacterized protein YkwD
MHARAALVGAVLLLAWGCTDSGSSGSDAPQNQAPAVQASPAESTDLHTYGNDHPLMTDSQDPILLEMEGAIFIQVNDHRISIGLDALTHNDGLAQTSRAHSKHMYLHSFHDHTNPEGDGPWERSFKNGLPWNWVGENYTYGFGTAEGSMDFWLNSPPHKHNIEDPTWTHTGVGYWNVYPHATQMFGKIVK